MSSVLRALPEPRLSRPAWLSPRVARTEVLAGLVVALALIPEAISFSILAGVDPRGEPGGPGQARLGQGAQD
jgi:SulP family sulfate permease